MTVTTCLSFSLPATPASVRKARVSVADAAAGLGASQRVVDDIRLCVSEAVSNVVRHAYNTKRGVIDVALERENGELNVVVRDEGRGMDTEAPNKTTAGGYGLRIIDAVADRMTITSADETGTEVRMKFLSVPAML
ncbi:MAG: ATP-binding protein [Actinomycetota bacterium]|nr:ATP-binding protein [Actinomycetota bacterium]